MPQVFLHLKFLTKKKGDKVEQIPNIVSQI